MTKHLFMIVALWLAYPAGADTVVATRTIRAQTLLTAADLAVVEGKHPGAITTIDDAIGLEARVMLYTGRPISRSDIAPAAIIARNQIVPLVYSQGGLSITAEGRALDRAAVGDFVRVMNLSSRTTVSGVVAPDGSIHVGGTPSH